MSQTLKEIKTALLFLSDAEKQAFYPRFFKAGKGEYAEGDQFIGVTVPEQRKIAKEYCSKISLKELQTLISSPIHEHRLTALLMLVTKFEKAETLTKKEQIVYFYLKNKQYINNWDLVDNSCYKILGRYCYEIKDSAILINLSEEENMWSKRMAVVSTMYYIKNNVLDITQSIVLKNLYHPHDLMHKANGWLLREMGKKNEESLLHFLKLHNSKMPRTTLRYAIEKLEEEKRKKVLKGIF